MKIITIKRLRLENFKCHRLLELDLGGKDASLYGDNATGKSSCYDALTWLLFGKDSHGSAQAEVKPLNGAGEVADHEAITTVEAVLTVDGVDIALRREFRELWTTKRGSATPTFDGNVSEYYVDGVPVRMNQFKAATRDLVDEDTFRMLTGVYFFAGELPWQKRREILGQVAQLPEDRQIMETDGRFAALLDGMGNLDLAGYKARLLADAKGLKGARNEIPARIDECQKTIRELEGLDFAGAKADLERLNRESEQMQQELLGIEHSNLADALQLELREAKLALSTLEAENKAFRQQQEARQPDTWGIRDQLRRAEADLSGDTSGLSRQEASLVDYEGKVSRCKADWLRVDGEQIEIAGNCPTCGQPLPPEKLREAEEARNLEKARRLQEIVDTANRYKGTMHEIQVRIDTLRQRCEDDRSRIDTLKRELEAAEGQKVTAADMDGYAERKASCEERIRQVQDRIFDMNTDIDGAAREIREKIGLNQVQQRQMGDVIAQEGVLRYTRQRIEQLRTDAREAAEKLARVDQLLFLIDEYTRYKVTFVEDTVNRQFKLARFRLFREQANGGLEDRCDVVYQGVPYGGLNSGAKINVGIDIINTLSRVYGVTVPLFVDNAESVTRLEQGDTQVIRLVVSEADKEIRMEVM